MAYNRYTWVDGEVITAQKLNHIEEGIEDAYELPAVTETDNGKVLGVENGQFGLVDGGGSDVVIIDANAVLNNTTWEVTSFGSSYNELKELVLAKKYIVVRLVHRNPNAPYAQLSFLPLIPGTQAEFPSGMSSVISFQAINMSYYSSIKVWIWDLGVHDDGSITLTYTYN